MKKFKMIIISLLVTVLVFNIPIQTFGAMENNDASGDIIRMISNDNVKGDVVNKSIEAFPEFETKIKGENTEEIKSALMRRSGIGEVIYTETRMLSENEMVTYIEYESGIAATAFGLMEGKKVTQSYSEGNRYTYIMNVWLQYGGSQSVLFVEDFEYIIYSNTYDVIKNEGNHKSMSTAVSPIIEELKKEEDADVAKAMYGAGFVFDISYSDYTIPITLYAHLIIEVGNNTCVISSKAA